MLQSKKAITASEIAERFEISMRTVYRDMRALNEAGVPIGAEAGLGYYLVEGYHLPPVMFTPEEAASLLIAEKLMEKFGDNSLRNSFKFSIDKIKSVLPDNHKEYIGGLDDQVHVFHFKDSPNSDFSNNYAAQLQKAMAEKKCAQIEYFAKYTQVTTSREIEPLALCFYGFQWHLVAYCNKRADFRDFRLDRIKSLEVVDKPNMHIEGFSASNYFNELWTDSAILKAKIVFDKKYTTELSNVKYYYGFYEQKETDQALEMYFAVSDFEYIANWLINLENAVLEIHPPELKLKIEKRVRTLAKKYLVH